MVPVSVIVPCFNASRWIRETFQSVTAQDCTNIELIAVDDGSTDCTARIIREEFPFVRLVTTENLGASKARNLGTSFASGDFIQFLDADDLLAPGKLVRQVKALDESGADVAYGNWQKLMPDEKGRHIPGPVVSRQMTDPEIDLFGDFWCPPAVYLFRRSIVERTGGWSETLPVIQDARFAFDCATRGAQFVYCPGVMASYRVHTSGSVSTRDPVAFVRDCLRNASEIEKLWTANSGINEARRGALLNAYLHAARASFENDPATFEQACEALERLQPGYIPESPRHLAVASRMVGYRRAEQLALWYRRAKKHLVRSF